MTFRNLGIYYPFICPSWSAPESNELSVTRSFFLLKRLPHSLARRAISKAHTTAILRGIRIDLIVTANHLQDKEAEVEWHGQGTLCWPSHTMSPSPLASLRLGRWVIVCFLDLVKARRITTALTVEKGNLIILQCLQGTDFTPNPQML